MYWNLLPQVSQRGRTRTQLWNATTEELVVTDSDSDVVSPKFFPFVPQVCTLPALALAIAAERCVVQHTLWLALIEEVHAMQLK